jgi:hypothetical protein
MSLVTIFAVATSVALVLPLAAATAQTIIANEPSALDFAVGVFNAIVRDGARTLPEAQLEFRYGEKLLYLGPAIGIMANTRKGGMIYGGLYADVALGPIVLTPFGGIGDYHRGNGKDLGREFTFRASLSARYQRDDGSRVGIQFAHISNAYTGRINPGEQEILITYAIPVGRK